MNQQIFPVLPELFTKTQVMVLDFNSIPIDAPDYQNIRTFFETCTQLAIDPKLPENRQKFNDTFIDRSDCRYAIGQYAEDRIEMLKGSAIAQEGRTIHLGIDIFSKDLDIVSAPYDVEIVAVGKEPGNHSYGNYIILKPDSDCLEYYIFIGHLSRNVPKLGTYKQGSQIAQMGDYIDLENGGWSRHIHVQLLSELSAPGTTPIGYSTPDNLTENKIKYPDPSFLMFADRTSLF